jgi:Tfp pilus assembly protein PilF
VTDEDHLWANTYDSELTAENIFDLQSDIARTIAEALQAELSPSDVETLQTVPTTDSEALEKYLLAMQIAKRRTYEALRQAESYLVDASHTDPSFVDAWTGLALVRGELFATGAINLQRYTDGAGLAVSKALELDPRNAVGIAEKARILAAENKVERAEEAFQTALRLAPQNSNVHENYGEWLISRGRLEDAREVLQSGLEYDPLSPLLLFQLGRVEMYLGNPQRNVELGKRLLDIDPSTVYGYVALLQARIWQGQLAKAWPWYVKTIETDADDYETWAHAAVFMEDLGLPEYADRYLAKAESLSANAPVVVKCKVMILETRGRQAEAVALVRRSLEAGIDDRWGSDRVLLRTIRDDAFDSGNLDAAIALYRDRTPSLFAENPVITMLNASQTADLGLLLESMGESERAQGLLAAALKWYDRTQSDGVYGYVLGILKPELLAVAGDSEAAVASLRHAIESGYRWQWRWALKNPNFDSIRDLPAFRELQETIEADMDSQRMSLAKIPDLGEFDLRDAPAE